MHADSTPESRNSSLAILRKPALIASFAGASGSVGSTLYVGRHNSSLILIGLFVLWVLSPFAALLFAGKAAKRWSNITQTTLYSLMLILALGSLAIYANVALGPPRSQPAFLFLIVPLASWVLIAVILPAAAVVSSRMSGAG